MAGHQKPWDLYDLSQDRSETKNLAAEQSERVDHLAAAYEAWAKRAQVLAWPLR